MIWYIAKGDELMIKLNVLVPEEMKNRGMEIAAELDRNFSWVVRKALEEYIERYNEGQK